MLLLLKILKGYNYKKYCIILNVRQLFLDNNFQTLLLNIISNALVIKYLVQTSRIKIIYMCYIQIIRTSISLKFLSFHILY